MNIFDVIDYSSFFENGINYLNDIDVVSLVDIVNQFDVNTLSETKKYLYELFKKQKEKIPYKKIYLKEDFFRSRYGFNVEKGLIDDCSIDVIFPYFGKDLIQPPTSFAKGGRFNAEGESYLYLSSNIETCISELRLDVGEKCSVGKFCCKRVFNYVDFTSNKMSFLFNVVKQLLLAPVHSDNKSYYLLTQSIAKVFKVLNFHGICYPSTQVNSEKNYNVVCFYPKDFYFVNYSDEIYIVEAINYSYSKLNESYKEYCDCDMLLNLENEIESKRKENLFDYIRQKINYEKKHNSCNMKRKKLIKNDIT